MSDKRPSDIREIPDDVVEGRRTPTFTAQTVPPGLLKAHLTAAWAELVVVEGEVGFVDEESGWTATAHPDEPVVIVPGVAHFVTPGEHARFYVQFYDQADSAAKTGSVQRSEKQPEVMPQDAGVGWRQK